MKFSASQSGSSNDQQVCCFKDTVFTSSYNVCTENTCANLKNPPENCPKDESNACVCREGLYRNECNECVMKEECSKNCTRPTKLQCTGQFEMLYGCLDPTQARVCPTTRCSKPRDFLLKYAKRSNQSGLCALNTCDCIDGYLRNKCGQCVPANECGRKSCIGKFTPCSEPNEVRVKKYRKCTARTCKNLKSPMKCKGKAARVRKNMCDCKIGYRRNKCGKCVPETECNDNVPCVCTNPCLEQGPTREWQCLNECNRPTCKNYYELPAKRCSSECTYVCSCSGTQNLWFNGTVCVRGDRCPPYEIAKDYPYVPLNELVRPVPASRRMTPAMPTTASMEPTTTAVTQKTIPIVEIPPSFPQSPTVSPSPTTTQSPSNPLISINLGNGLGLSVGKK